MKKQFDLNILQQRHSVRNYDEQLIPTQTVNMLKETVDEINATYPGIRFRLVFNNGEAFSSFRRSYGQFKGVKNYLVAVVDTAVENAEEIAGFAGEQFVLTATEAGLGTCFVGATFDPSKVQIILSATEKIGFLIPFGYEHDKGPGVIGKMMMKVVKGKSKTPEEFYDNNLGFINLQEASARMPQLAEGLEALACSPSGMNKQPVRVWVGEDTYLHMSLAVTGDYTSYDLGIAKFNYQAVVPGQWQWGVDGRFEQI